MKNTDNRYDKKLSYVLVGIINTVFGLTLFPILYYCFPSMRTHYVILLSISQVACISSAFLTNKFLVFRTKGRYFFEYLKFSSVYVLYFIANLLLLPFLVNITKYSPMILQTIISLSVFLTSYFWHSNITFTNGLKSDKSGDEIA